MEKPQEIEINGKTYVLKEEKKDDVKKWEPKGGRFWIDKEGEITLYVILPSSGCEDTRNFGMEYKTGEQAEKARDAMCIQKRLLAYKMEFCPDWEPDWKNGEFDKYEIFYDNNGSKYSYIAITSNKTLGAVYFPKKEAQELCKKLNSGEVVL